MRLERCTNSRVLVECLCNLMSHMLFSRNPCRFLRVQSLSHSALPGRKPKVCMYVYSYLKINGSYSKFNKRQVVLMSLPSLRAEGPTTPYLNNADTNYDERIHKANEVDESVLTFDHPELSPLLFICLFLSQAMEKRYFVDLCRCHFGFCCTLIQFRTRAEEAINAAPTPFRLWLLLTGRHP